MAVFGEDVDNIVGRELEVAFFAAFAVDEDGSVG